MKRNTKEKQYKKNQPKPVFVFPIEVEVILKLPIQEKHTTFSHDQINRFIVNFSLLAKKGIIREID